MRLSTALFRAARLADDAEAIGSGSPRRVARRGRNILIGRSLGRLGFWSLLFGGRR